MTSIHYGRRITLGRLVYRHLTGLEYDGRPRTDAGWTTRGTRALTPSGRALRWAYRPRIQRAAIRWGWTAIAAVEAYGAVAAPTAAEVGAGTIAAGTVGYASWRTAAAISGWRHRRRLETPLAVAAAPVLGVSPQIAAAALQIDRRYADTRGGEHVGRWLLPDHFHADADQQRRMEALIESRLGIDCDFRWRMSRQPMVLEVTRAPVPPDLVTLAEVREAIDRCEEGQVVLGKDARGQIFYGDFLREDPHWGISAGSRRGKTTLLCLVAAQILRQGGERVTGIDPKMISLDPLVGVPRVDIHNDPRNVQDMWDAVADFRAHMDERMEAYSKDKTLEFRRSLLIIDEINQFAAMSRSYWRAIKSKEDPAVPPVWADIAAIAWQGAQLKCNMIVAGQRLDSQATGGEGIRDSFGIRMLAGYTPQQWNFLVGTYPVPRSQKPRGRFIIVNGGDHTWIQTVKADPGEIRDLAMEPVRRAAGASPASVPTGTNGAEGTGDIPAALPVRYGLREASADEGVGIVPLTYAALKKARQRDAGFPAGRITPGGTTYTADELAAWYQARNSRTVGA